jgi:hypothetical protein
MDQTGKKGNNQLRYRKQIMIVEKSTIHPKVDFDPPNLDDFVRAELLKTR